MGTIFSTNLHIWNQFFRNSPDYEPHSTVLEKALEQGKMLDKQVCS